MRAAGAVASMTSTPITSYGLAEPMTLRGDLREPQGARKQPAKGTLKEAGHKAKENPTYGLGRSSGAAAVSIQPDSGEYLPSVPEEPSVDSRAANLARFAK